MTFPQTRKLFVGMTLAWSWVASVASADPVDFSHDVAPILRKRCGECHAGDAKKGGLSLNTRETILTGGESGPAAVAKDSGKSELIARVLSADPDVRMPPKGDRVTADEAAILKRWIDEGLAWESGFSFGKIAYEPPLAPRRPELPPARDGLTRPIDRVVDAYFQGHGVAWPGGISDGAFARRASLDLIGLPLTPEELEAFVADQSPDKRDKLIDDLLARDVDYADHWLTFWNDLLRNDYTGTGFITGGRKQITTWLYRALLENKPYDQFARELIAPATDESRGFIDGIRWRGEVSAGQTVEIQFAQSVAQSFLGINLKCASCHDSFIDRWKLDESYALAAIYANQPLEVHRCDKPVGRKAKAGWLFPELGDVDPNQPPAERLKRLAELMTTKDNGRFARTIVNRMWHRLMGRGIVHPVDAMQTEPWSADLLDHLAVRFVDDGHDLKKLLAAIAKSRVYQCRTIVRTGDDAAAPFVFRGPQTRRLTAEQFVDSVRRITGTGPTKMDAAVVRGKAISGPPGADATAKWIWSKAAALDAPGGETIVVRKRFTLDAIPVRSIAAAACDNRYELWINGRKVQTGERWDAPDVFNPQPAWKMGENEIRILAANGAQTPNPAGLLFEARLFDAEGKVLAIGTDEGWEFVAESPAETVAFKRDPKDWRPAAAVEKPEVWAASRAFVGTALSAGAVQPMIRDSLVKSDFLTRALGRPNRDQIVSMRPESLSTLEAMELSNNQQLADYLARGAETAIAQGATKTDAFARRLFLEAYGRVPTDGEARTLQETFGGNLTPQAAQDLMWAVFLSPEFQLVR